MAKLSITTNQKDLILEPMDASLESAFQEGVETPGPTAYLDAMPGYKPLKAIYKTMLKSIFKAVSAAYVKAMGFDQPGVGTADVPVEIPVTDGSITVVGGLIINHNIVG